MNTKALTSSNCSSSTNSGRLAIGLDIGGSGAKVGLVDQSGRILLRQRISTPAHDQPGPVVDEYAAKVGELLRHCAEIGAQPVGIGVGIPGHISPDRRSSLFYI